MSNIFDLFKKISSEGARPCEPISHIIVGLGNPGTKYKFTRHNAGFLMMDYLSEKAGVWVDRAKFNALTAEATIAGKRVLLMKPQTFMNKSGEAVRDAVHFYKIPMENVLVFSDDISLEPGRSRLRAKGSDGGQRGLRSIIELTGTDNFPRMKFGVGAKPHPDYDLADWVISEFRDEEKKAIFSAFEQSYGAVLRYLEGDFAAAVQICNSAKKEGK